MTDLLGRYALLSTESRASSGLTYMDSQCLNCESESLSSESGLPYEKSD